MESTREKIKINGLKNSFEFFQELGEAVHNSQYTESHKAKMKSESDELDYNYIDLLAIVQVINSENTKMEKKKKTSKRKKAAE